jgi:hypothetical protein
MPAVDQSVESRAIPPSIDVDRRVQVPEMAPYVSDREGATATGLDLLADPARPHLDLAQAGTATQ